MRLLERGASKEFSLNVYNFMFECNYVYITEGVEKEKVATTVKGSGGFLN